MISMTIVTNWHSHNSTSCAMSACPALGVAHVRRQFIETVLQDQHHLRRVGALFGVPGIARDGYHNDPTGNAWQQGRDNLSVHTMWNRNVEVCRIGLSHRPKNDHAGGHTGDLRSARHHRWLSVSVVISFAIIVARDNTKPDRIATEFMNAFARNSSVGP